MKVKSYDESGVSELFHENSKQHRSDHRIAERIITMATNPLLQRMAATHKRYPSAHKIELPRDLPESTRTFTEAVLTRRSSRDFRRAPVSLPLITTLLYLGNGITGSAQAHDGRTQHFRAAPSGGALYPVELYVIAMAIEDLPQGIYHYEPVSNMLEAVRTGDRTERLQAITYTDEIDSAAAAIVLTGISLKNRIKYSERGYRFMLMEAGHIAQNILLTASAYQLAAVPIGGFVDDELDELLGIDGLDEVSLYLVAIGQSGADARQS
jgi:SagB-type dehydrogenase family enzyme